MVKIMAAHKCKTYEEFARLNLQLLFPQYRFECLDKPDLQDVNDNIGIEVTSSTPTEIRERTAYGDKYLGKEITLEEEEKYRGTVFHMNNTRIVDGYSARDLLYAPEYVKEIDDVLKKKCQKSNDYKHFQFNGVYVFTGTHLVDSKDVNALLSHKVLRCFDFVLLDNFGKVHFLINDTFFILNIEDKDYNLNWAEAVQLCK